LFSNFPPQERGNIAPMQLAMPRPLQDARCWQIASLALLLTYGTVKLGFEQPAVNIALILATALATQALLTWTFKLPRFDPLSAITTSLSLSILLRADPVTMLMLAAAFAMASKFLIRVNGKHVFNPANFAITVLILSDAAWISPAQWGSAAWGAFLIASLAILVLSQAKRADIALTFLGTFAALVFLRAGYLGDPLAIPLKQMQSGALLLFSFFMISDPKTTPDTRAGRMLFAVLVACAAHYLIFLRYRPEGLMYALFFLSPLVPLIDRVKHVLPEERFAWRRPAV
jgi:Na+-translocating ferredoxin:NAD+ oxidoreductase RnfD subunit